MIRLFFFHLQVLLADAKKPQKDIHVSKLNLTYRFHVRDQLATVYNKTIKHSLKIMGYKVPTRKH